MKRQVNVISGLTLSGKSWLLEKLLQIPEFRSAAVIRMDDIRKQFWGDKPITSVEGIFRNELTRMMIKAQLIIDEAPLILVELPMLSRKNHQEPFVQMIRETEWFIQEIEKERADKEGRALSELTTVALRVVLLYCSPQKAHERLPRRRDGADATNTIVFDEDQYLSIATRFELPDEKTYVPLPVNTTDDDKERILQEVLDFLNGRLLDQELTEKRLGQAQQYLNEAKEEARRRGIIKLLI